MKYKIGAYSFDVSKPFKTNDEAIKHVQERYPELSKDEIVKHLKPSIKDESTSAQKEHSESNSGSAKANRSNNNRS